VTENIDRPSSLAVPPTLQGFSVIFFLSFHIFKDAQDFGARI
jgi:hypothetical protein